MSEYDYPECRIERQEWEQIFAFLRDAGVDHAWRLMDGDGSALIIVLDKEEYDRCFPGEDGQTRPEGALSSRVQRAIRRTVDRLVWVTYKRPPDGRPFAQLF